MISDDAYRRLEAVGKQLLHDGDITPAGLKVLYSVIIAESEKDQQEALREHSRLAQAMLPAVPGQALPMLEDEEQR